tara:strand:+ start:117 stop:350 length:234 start_codon:yes stop_codon:yes gene_type:complete
MLTPEFYTLIGIAGSVSVGYIALKSWCAIKSHIKSSIEDLRHDMETEIYREMDIRQDDMYRQMEDNQDKLEREIEKR